VDLDTAPPSNAFLKKDQLSQSEEYIPLRVLVCEKCWLVQTDDFTSAESIFNPNYAYFSGLSKTWLNHCENYVTQMIDRFNLNENSIMVEVAANDGSLLQYAAKNNIPCYGIEPTTSTSTSARSKGLEIFESFFTPKFAKHLVSLNKQADLICANNVLAHVPDINSFVQSFQILLKPEGVVTFEFPHILRLIDQVQFDTIYHEHFSYLSLLTVQRILESQGMQVFDVEEITTHGGSLRIYAQNEKHCSNEITKNVGRVLSIEKNFGINTINCYQGFQSRVEKIKLELLHFLINAKVDNKKVVAYGAAAKGNTLLNYAGIKSDLIDYVVDLNPVKQGKYLPGSRIPVLPESNLKITQPNYIIILPWNIKGEIIKQLDYTRRWNSKFAIFIPKFELL
jgi:2-polyprenyl-3-methyl-5-hydroxy-6-metoxy-1,4-benzoquinol methylase